MEGRLSSSREEKSQRQRGQVTLFAHETCQGSDGLSLFKKLILFDIKVTWGPLEHFGREKKVHNPTIRYLWVCALFFYACLYVLFYSLVKLVILNYKNRRCK